MSASGGDHLEVGVWAAITKQLGGTTECAAASEAMKAFYGPEGPDVVLHCNLLYGHEGDHEFATQWPRTEKEKP